jgi:NAD(P)-dependent dehydrogenase (short-subunit alcohol dehydrogenase family)
MYKIEELLNFKGKVVIITGGSTGIGEGCVRVFKSASATVIFCARNKDRGEALANELNTKGSENCYFIKCDVSNPDEMKLLIDKTLNRYGRLDCLINNAGYHPLHHPIDEFSIEDFKNVIQSNLVSIFSACKYALPYLRQTKGAIINMSSLVGNIGQEWATTYCATKGGIISFTKALAIEESRYGVRVNVVLPGNIITESRKRFTTQQSDSSIDWDKMIDGWQWMGRSGTIEEVGWACLFLASKLASYITGVELIISGGSELGYGNKYPSKFNLE